ncbi:CvpA family protein [Paenibacillus mesotrionivorans]|uniref:CvpA family protein n=1 Tax=Paenibacillus mesotrionivorans TaxID=3160968 RepID=A0ACC7NSK5_9BACL
MNKLDLAVLVLGLLAFILGYRRGFILQLVSFLSLVVAWIAAYLFYDDLAPYVGRLLPVEVWVDSSSYSTWLKGLRLDQYVIGAVSFAVIVFGVKLVLTAAGHLLNVLAKVPGLNLINRWSGGILGLAEAAVLAAVAIQVMAVLPNEPVQHLLEGSRAAEWSMQQVSLWFAKMKELP